MSQRLVCRMLCLLSPAVGTPSVHVRPLYRPGEGVLRISYYSSKVHLLIPVNVSFYLSTTPTSGLHRTLSFYGTRRSDSIFLLSSTLDESRLYGGQHKYR